MAFNYTVPPIVDGAVPLSNKGMNERLAWIMDVLQYIANNPGGGGGGGVAQGAAHAFTAYTIAAGGTAQDAFVPVANNGGYIKNPLSATENLYVDLVSAPPSTDAAADTQGTTTILQPGDVFVFPPLTSAVHVKLNAATTGHKISGVYYA